MEPIPKVYNERLRQAAPMGITFSAARPTSPTGSGMKPINVLSEPHLPMDQSTHSTSPNAITRLQQTLEKSDTKVFEGLKLGTSDPDRTQTGRSLSGSGASVRVATTTAREMVAGLFGRRKPSVNSLKDAASEMSKSPTSSLASGAAPSEAEEEEYLYNLSIQSQDLYSPTSRQGRKVRSSCESQRQTAYTTYPHFSSPSTLRKSPPGPIDITSSRRERSGEDRHYQFSPLTLTQSRCDNRMQAMETNAAGQRSGMRKSRRSVQDIFMANGDPQAPGQDSLPMDSSNSVGGKDTIHSTHKSTFCSPAKALIRQSSTSSSLSNITDFSATSSREGSIHRSGRAALTSVLTSPKFNKATSQKLTSLTPVNYRLPDTDGYISFPPFVPGSYFGGSLAGLFGRNGSTSSLGPESKKEENKTPEPTQKHDLRRSLVNFSSHMRQASISTMETIMK